MRTALWLPLVVCAALALSVEGKPSDAAVSSTRSKSCPPGSKVSYISKKWCKCEPPQPEFYGSLIFVIDITGSMQPELNAVKENIERILRANTRFKDYVVALFGDPYIRRVRRSSSKSVIWNFIRPIRASSGGDCPEYSLSGIEDALKEAHGKSVLFLFTDAAAKDRKTKEKKVIAMLKKRRVEVIVIATGQLCHGSYKNEYHNLVSVRGGRVIRMNKEEISDVMTYVIKGVSGKLSFKGFPKDADKLRASLEGTCSCRIAKIKKCIPLPKPKPKPKPDCPRGFKKQIKKEKTCSCKPIRPENNYGSLIFVVDITNSMQTEIDIVKDNIKKIVKANRRFSNYVIATFGDPYVRQVLKSNDKKELWDRLDSIFARGGGDCPEYSLSAVVDAAKKADENSVMFLFTDACAKDYKTKLDQAKKILVEKHTQIITVATGDLCKKQRYPYHNEYDILAKATGGQVAHLSKGQMKKVMKFMLKAVAGEVSFQAFPSSASKLDSVLKGSCECREELLISCVKIDIKCPKDYASKGRCVDGKRTETRYTYRVVKGVCVKSGEKTIRYKGCEHTKCKKSKFVWSPCVAGWKSRTEYLYTYKESARKCVRTSRKVGRSRCKMPCPVYKRVLKKGSCYRHKGKFYRNEKYQTNIRHKVYLCKRVTKTRRVRCNLSPCPKSRVVRGVCKAQSTRGHKKGRKSVTFSHSSGLYTHDKHIYYVRNSRAKCVRKVRVQRRLCATKMCRCFAIGDPHYKTFDRLRIDFYGGCKYILAETVSSSGECAFRISGKNWYRGRKLKHRVSWTKYIELTIGGHTYKLGQQRLLFVDNQPTLVPHRLHDGLGYIFYSGRAIEFASEKCGINVYWDGKSAAGVQINRAKYGGHVRGLCGNCDGDASNDLTDRAGTVYKDRSYANVQKLALSYLVTEKSEESVEEIERCKDSDGPPEISNEVEKKYSEKEWCGIISKDSGPFSKCLSSGKISYEFYFRSCVIDLSLLEEQQTLLKQTYCEIIQAVNEDCAEVGFEGIDWRTHTDCTPKCPANSHFTTKMNPCPATCESAIFHTKRQCFKLPNREGCECKNGYVLDGQRCVRMGECSCLSCNDAAPAKQCARWKRQGHCKSLFETSGMLMACRKTCGFCHEKPACEDYIASSVCAKAKARGNCDKSFYKHFCGLTCNWRNCPCRSGKTIRGKCGSDLTRKVTIFRYKRGRDRECTLDQVVRRESCGKCVSNVEKSWGKCNYCTGKRVGKKVETYKSGIRCLKRRSAIYMSCSLCKFPNGKTRKVIDRFCKGGNTIITRYKVKRQSGCYKCSSEKTFTSKVISCRKNPRVSTTPVRGTKTEKLKICVYHLRRCRCLESCKTIVQPTECKPRSLIKKRCVIRNRAPVWKSFWQYERLVRKKLKTRCERYRRTHIGRVVCPKRLKSITIRGKNCKLSARITFYHVSSKCACTKVVKYRSKGFYCCPKPKTKKGPCSIKRGVNVMRTVRTTFYKLVKGSCIRQTSGKRHQVCNCRPNRFKRDCQFGKLSQRVMKCRLTRGSRGNYCKCWQEKIDIPVTCRATSTRKLTGCTIRKGLNRFMKVRYFYSAKERCKCVKRHRDRLVWCGCHSKPMYEVKPCPKKCKDPKRCSNRCVKQHIRYVGMMKVRNKRKVCVRKIVSLKKERCCCSPVVLDLKPRKKCVSGSLLIKYTYSKKLCHGKRSKLAQCCVVRRSRSRRVACKQGVIKTEASRCGRNGYFTITKTIAKLKKCKCTRKVRRSTCRCKCPKKKKRVACDAGKRIWRETIVSYKIVNCKCKRRVVAREFPLNPCKRMPKSPSKVGKCNKKGIKKLYYFYSVRSGCKCKKRTKVRTCRCRCSSRVSYTKWKCNAKSGLRTRVKTYVVRRGCHCVAKRKVEKRQTRCHRRRKVEKICRRGVLAFFLREYRRRGCKCSWKVTNVVRRRCDPPQPPKEIVKKKCISGNVRVLIRTKIRWVKKTIRLFDKYYHYTEKVVSKSRNSSTVTCKKRFFPPDVRPCKKGKYLKVTRYVYVGKCKCKVGAKRVFKSCICRKSMKRESTKCDKKRFAIVSTWKYRKWSSAQESCIWVRKTVRSPVHCSFKNRVVRGRCLNGKTYKITTHVQLPDRNKCKCLKLKESRTANCFCKPIVRRKKCDKGSCVRFTVTTPMKWNYKKSRCVPFGKKVKKRIICCCSKSVKRRTYCAPDGHRRVTRTWQVYSSRPIPRCIQKKRTDKLVINCQAAKYQTRLLRRKSSRSACGRNNYLVIRYYKLRLNKKKCTCEKYVYRKKRCRCRCRRGEKFERSFCKKGTNKRVRVYSRMLLKNCGCVKKLVFRASSVRCRRKPISTKWSRCNKKSCHQYRIDTVERPRNCKCKSLIRRRVNIRRKCCCNKQTTSDSVCTKMGWKVTTVYYTFDIRTRRCARKTRQNVVQDDELINCKNNPRHTRVKAANCALVIYHNRYWIDFRKCECRKKSRPVKAGKWCCSKKRRVKRHCRNRMFVFVTTVQKLKGMKCVNKYSYRKKSVPCKRGRNVRGKCNKATGWATDYISEARVMLNCFCKKTRVPKKRRCACPKPRYITDCLKNAGIVRKIKISFLLRSGRCVRKRKVISETKVCTKKPVLHHSSGCKSNNYITDTYKAQRRVGCDCFTKYFNKQRLCRCEPSKSKKAICKGRYLRVLHYMHFVNKKYTACNKKIVSKEKVPIRCRSSTNIGKCQPSGMKGRMVQRIERIIRHIKKCKCKTKRVIESTRICKCPDAYKKKGSCNRETEKRKITYFSFTLNSKRTKCRRHQRITYEVCYCNKRARKTTKCDRRSGNKLIISTWRQFSARTKSCVRKRKTDIREVQCDEKTTRTKTDCTASGWRTDIIKKHYKDFKSCSCRHSPRPIKVRCECVPKCHKKVVRCVGGQLVIKQKCYRLKAVSPYVNQCVPYYLKKTKSIKCCRRVKYQRNASCKKCVKKFHLWVYKNIKCKCKRVKKFWKKVRCCCPKKRCRTTCEMKGKAKVTRCTWYKLTNGSCVRHIDVRVKPVKCLKRQEYWSKCRKQKANGRWFRCSVLKSVIRSAVKNCKCQPISTKVHQRYCCCGPKTVRNSCNAKTGVTTRTITKKVLVGEGFCKPVPRKKIIPAPTCHGTYKGENYGKCDLKRNQQKFFVWTVYRHGCKCKKRKAIKTTACGCRHKKPLGPFWTKCVKGVRKVYFYYFERVKIGRWRYKCVKKRVNHNVVDRCKPCGKRDKTNRVCKGAYWLRITTGWRRKTRKIKIPGRYHGSIRVSYRLCVRTRKSKPSRSISCPDPPEYKAKCNNFRKRIYRYYNLVRQCACRLKRSLVTVRACMCHKKNYSTKRCNTRTNQIVTSNYIYTAKKRVCIKKRRDVYSKVPCRVGKVVRDKTVIDCKNGRRKGLSKYKKVRYYIFYYSHCKCKKRFFAKWKLCGCASKKKREVCRNGKWYSTLYSVTPIFDRNACEVTKRFVNRDVSCSRNARKKLLSPCNASCIRKYAIYYRRLDRRTCRCRVARPIIVRQVCGCNKCPKVGRNKITKRVSCDGSDGIKIFTTIKKVFVHNGNLFNRWDISVPKYTCIREVKRKKNKIVCTKGSVITKEKCVGAIRKLTVKRQVRVACRCRVKYNTVPGGRCKCKGKEPKPPKVWKSDNCSKPPYMRRVTIYSYKLDKSDPRKWKCKVVSKVIKQRCGCPKKEKNSAYCNGKGSIIHKKTYKKFIPKLRSCVWKNVLSKKAASCSKAQLAKNELPPRRTTCKKSTNYMVTYVKKWYEVDPRDCKCKLKTKHWRCPCRCAHKNKIVNKRCIRGHIITYTAVNFVKKGCKCLKTTRGRRKFVTCKHKREDQPDRIVIGQCQRKGPNRNAGYVRVVYEKEYPRRCKCKTDRRKRWEPCDCSLIPQYKSRSRLICHKSGAYFNRVTTYYVVQLSSEGGSFCEKRRRSVIVRINKCFDRRGRPLRRKVTSGFDKCSRRRTRCNYKKLIQQSIVRKCACKWKTIEVIGKKCCCDKPTVRRSCLRNDTKVKITKYYILDGSGNCVKKTKKQKYKLTKKKSCKYSSGYVVRCTGRRKQAVYRKYYQQSSTSQTVSASRTTKTSAFLVDASLRESLRRSAAMLNATGGFMKWWCELFGAEMKESDACQSLDLGTPKHVLESHHELRWDGAIKPRLD
ncbi:hypothetical protein BOX15_Mlig022224g1 [Macrostomum lignano]|uniref:VWFA domain-containing protein n=1 Tax=Macrostomum lignano TaxID=282301 RepID=A0A267GJ37_9PLAT|nr:hypothetical protein BOX15_Mlig022224g1 [Macrostomum lignano]